MTNQAMMRPDDTVAVRIRIPRTRPRIALGTLSLAVGILFLLDLSITGGFMLWGASILLGQTHQVVSIENDLLVLRTISPFAPKLTRRIGMDRVRGRSFTVAGYKQDAVDKAYRPVIGWRLWLLGDGGVPIFRLGMALTVEEATAALEPLNRLLQTAGSGLERPITGAVEDDYEFPL